MKDNPILQIESPELKSIFTKGEDGLPLFKTFLAGEWFQGEDWQDVRTPIDLSMVAKVPKIPPEMIYDILNTVYVRGRWHIRAVPGEKRLEIYHKASEMLEKNKEDFANVLMINSGKTYVSSMLEVNAAVERFRKSDLDARKILGDYVPGDWSLETLETEAIVKREPLGVVLAIIPFNYPLFDAVNKFVYSTIAGNSIIIKPASSTPLPVLMLARILELCGFPKLGFTVLTVAGKEMNKIVSDKRISGISLTGNSKTGIELLRSSGIKQYVMELGGGDPAVVTSDAEITWAVQRIARGIYSYTGQRCDAIKLVLAEEPIYELLREGLVNELKKVKVGDPRDPDVTIGPLIDEKAAEEVTVAVKDAIEKDGQVLLGGRVIGKNYVEPTLIEVTKDQIQQLYLYENEVFAPIATITEVLDIEEAIRIVNGRPYGLDASVFGKDPNKIRRLIRMLDVGSVYVNDYPRHGIGYFPFGGRKNSGIGREGIGYTLDYVTSHKTIVYNYKGKGIWEYL